MRTNKSIMNSNLTKLIALIIIVITILSIYTNVSANTQTNTISDTQSNTTTNTNTTTIDTKPSSYYGYYGITVGNGKETNIYIRINNNWERYIVYSDYVGYECKIITFDHKITSDNYKSLKVTNIIEPTNTDKAYEYLDRYVLYDIFGTLGKEGK